MRLIPCKSWWLWRMIRTAEKIERLANRAAGWGRSRVQVVDLEDVNRHLARRRA